MLAIFRKRGRLMAGLIAVSGLAGLGYYVSARPIYFSKARVRIETPANASMEARTVLRELNAATLIERTARRLGRKGSARELQLRNILHQSIRPVSEKRFEIDCRSKSAELARRWPATLVEEFQREQRETSARDFQQMVRGYRREIEEVASRLGRKVDASDPAELQRALMEMEQFEAGPTELARVSQRLDRFGQVRIELENASLDVAAKLALINALSQPAEGGAPGGAVEKQRAGSDQGSAALSTEYQQARGRFELEYQALIKQKTELEMRASAKPGEPAAPGPAPDSTSRISRRPLREVAVELRNKIERFEEERKNAVQLTFEGTVETRAQRATPELGTLLLFSLLTGGALALGLPLILACFDRSLASPREVESVLGLRVLGMVPQRAGRGDSRQPGPEELERFRPIAKDLQALRATDSGALVVMVSSALRGEGKTSAAANLGRALGDLDWKTAVVDCDFSRGRIHRRFGYRRTPGLADVLREECTLEEVCRITAQPDLSVVPAGAPADHGTELLGGEAFAAVIQKLREDFDGVVLDTPPVLGFSETSILQKQVDGVVLVIRGGVTPRANVQAAIEMLKVNGANFFGAVLNGVDQVGTSRKSGQRRSSSVGAV